MSAPHTDLEKQTRRHRGPLIGMVIVVLFAVGIIVYWILDEAANGTNPTEQGGDSSEQDPADVSGVTPTGTDPEERSDDNLPVTAPTAPGSAPAPTPSPKPLE